MNGGILELYKKYPKGLKLTPEKEYLVTENMGIAHKLTQKWFNGACDMDDIRQQAYLTLVDCAVKYDPNTGTKFNTYAYACIDIVLNNYVQGYNKLVNIPLNKIYKCHKYLSLPPEQQEEYRIQAKITLDDIEFYKTYDMLSIDAQVNDDYEDVTNLYAMDEKGYNLIDNINLLHDVIQGIEVLITDETNRNIFLDVIQHDFDKARYKELAKKYGLKIKQISDIVEDCQQIMKEHKSDFI